MPIDAIEEAIQGTLAECAKVRAFLGVTSATGAKARIYFDALPKPADKRKYTLDEWATLRPYLIISMEASGEALVADKTAQPNEFDLTSRIRIYAERNTPSELADDLPGAATDWKKTIGGIFKDFCKKSGQDGQINLTRLSVLDYFRAHPNVHSGEGDFQAANYLALTMGVL